MKKIAMVGMLFIIIILLYFMMNGEDLKITDKVRAENGGKSIALSDGVTYYKTGGPADKPLLLLIHGYTVPSFIWDDVYEGLIKKGEHVLMYDIYGSGFSDRPDASYNPEMFRRQIEELLRGLGIKGKISIAGLSMGGGIAADYIKHHPDMVKSAIFISPYHIPLKMPLIAKVILVPGIGDYLMTVIGDSVYKKRLKENFHRPLNYGEIENNFNYQLRFKGSKNALLMKMRNYMQNDYSESFKAVAVNRIPSILLWGKNDAVIPFKQSGEIISLIPEIEFFPLENMGHISTLEDPEKITSIIAAFIREKQ